MSVQIKVTGDKELVRMLHELPPTVYKRLLAGAVTKAARPVVTAAREKVSVETGALKKSLGVMLKKYPRKGIILAVIGARGGFLEKNPNGGRFPRNPTKYSHLVELGHKIVRSYSLKNYRNKYGSLRQRAGTGKTIGQVTPRPFLVPALKGRYRRVVDDIRNALSNGIEREAKRLARRGAA